MKPVILVTVYRRYHELVKNLHLTHLAANRLTEKPPVVVVWADPEPGKFWLFRELRSKGLVQHILLRKKCAAEGGATTYPESLNLRMGLEYISRRYPDSYVIGQAADVAPNPRAYGLIQDSIIGEGNKAIVFNLPCGATAWIWHTNFFAVRTTERSYWPPVSPIESPDMLESQWARQLSKLNYEGVVKGGNYNDYNFTHIHASEALRPFWEFPENGEAGVSLSIRGHLPFKERIRQWLKSALNLIPSRKLASAWLMGQW